MQITITFKNGAETVWQNVKSRELPSIFTDVVTLTEKVEAASKAFRQQGKFNGKKGAKSGHSRRLAVRKGT